MIAFARHLRLWKWFCRVAVAIAASGIFTALPVAGVQPTWIDTRRVGPFTVHSTFPLAEYNQLFQELPDLQRDICRTLGLPPARSPITIYLFSNADQYQRYIEQNYPKVPYRTALFISEGGVPTIFAYRKSDLDIDLRHECTHAMLHAVLPVVPLWLDEGLAKYFEVPANERAYGHPYFDDLRWKWSWRLGMVRSMEALEQRGDLAEMDAADYRSAWAWVHFMLHGPVPAHQALVSYLACYQQMTPAGRLSARVATVLPNPTQQMVDHFKHWRR